MTVPLHPSARTTPEIRREIQSSNERLTVLAKRFGINPKTVAKWKRRDSPEELPAGPRPGKHRKLTAQDEDIIVRFREHTLLPLDDCLYALQAQIPHLRRSSLHRCLQRHGVSNLARASGTGAASGMEACPPGHVHIDRSVVETGGRTLFLFNAMDRASKFVVVQKGTRGGPAEAAAFLSALTAQLPFAVRQVITPDAEPFESAGKAESPFTRACEQLGIEHRLDPTPHPWTRRRGARMGRMIEDSVSFASEVYLAQVLQDFVQAYNFRRRLKSLGGRTPYRFLCDTWQREPDLFLRDPHHESAGLEIVPG